MRFLPLLPLLGLLIASPALAAPPQTSDLAGLCNAVAAVYGAATNIVIANRMPDDQIANLKAAQSPLRVACAPSAKETKANLHAALKALETAANAVAVAEMPPPPPVKP